MTKFVDAAKRRRHKRLPSLVAPLSIEREYSKAIWSIVSPELRRLTLTLLPDLADLGEDEPITRDADKLRSIILRGRKEAKLDRERSADAARKAQTQSSDHGRKTSSKQAKAILGIDPFKGRPAKVRSLKTAVRNNVALIESIPERFFKRLERDVRTAVSRGISAKDLAAKIERDYVDEDGDGVRSARSVSKIIARDQVQKAVSAQAQLDQRELGIRSYTWRTSLDERVRELHAEREGKVFEWDDPPREDEYDGHPGEPPLCRCWAEPIFTDDVIEDLEPEEDDE